jgi:hypothetical protein
METKGMTASKFRAILCDNWRQILGIAILSTEDDIQLNYMHLTPSASFYASM